VLNFIHYGDSNRKSNKPKKYKKINERRHPWSFFLLFSISIALNISFIIALKGFQTLDTENTENSVEVTSVNTQVSDLGDRKPSKTNALAEYTVGFFDHVGNPLLYLTISSLSDGFVIPTGYAYEPQLKESTLIYEESTSVFAQTIDLEENDLVKGTVLLKKNITEERSTNGQIVKGMANIIDYKFSSDRRYVLFTIFVSAHLGHESYIFDTTTYIVDISTGEHKEVQFMDLKGDEKFADVVSIDTDSKEAILDVYSCWQCTLPEPVRFRVDLETAVAEKIN